MLVERLDGLGLDLVDLRPLVGELVDQFGALLAEVVCALDVGLDLLDLVGDLLEVGFEAVDLELQLIGLLVE